MREKKNTELDYFNFNFTPASKVNTRVSINSGLPLVSVITYYSLTEDITNTYTSLYNQTFPFFEWVIVTKSIDEKLKEIVKKDKRVRVVLSDFCSLKEFGSIGAVNAKTDVLVMLNETDLLDITFLETAYFTLYTNKEATFAYSRDVEFGEKNRLHNKRLTLKDELTKNIIPRCYAIRKDKFMEANESLNFDTNNYDWYMWLYLLSEKCVPIRMDYYGIWQKSKSKKSSFCDTDNTQAMQEYVENIKSSIDVNSKIIQFDDDPKLGFEDIPTPLSIGRKPIVPDDDKKRLLFILPWFVVGGADLFNYNLIDGLKKKGYEITIITTKKCNYELRQKAEASVDEYFDLTTFLNQKDWAGFIYYIIKSRRINCVFISNSFYGYYALPWLKYHFMDIPFVDYIHAENWTLRNGGFPRDSNSVANYLDATFTCTKHLKEIMFKIMKRHIKNVKSVYIGTDTEFYNPERVYEGQEELEEKYKDKKVILFISRMVHYKRPLFAIKVLQEILKVRDDVVLHLVGDGAALDDVRKYVKENSLEEHVEIFAMQKEVRKFYNVANLTLICSLREGLTLTTYESLSMGVPVVSSNVGGQKELIGDDVGYLIKPYQEPKEQFDFDYSQEEIEEYKEKILQIFENEKTIDYKTICRNKVIKRFSIQKMINDIDKEVTKVITSGSKVDKKQCDNIEFAQRYLLVHNMLENGNK